MTLRAALEQAERALDLSGYTLLPEDQKLISEARAALRRELAKPEPPEDLHERHQLLEIARDEGSRVRRALQTWDTPAGMELEELTLAIKARVVELEAMNVENKNRIAKLLEEASGAKQLPPLMVPPWEMR